MRGATIAGGGVPAGASDPFFIDEAPNRVTDHYGAVGGGWGNRVGNDNAGLGDAAFATVGGGNLNSASELMSTVGGGGSNTASGRFSNVGGGALNTASGERSTVNGGDSNTASGTFSTVGGGESNTASGELSTVGGGRANCAGARFSWAGGNQAKVRPAFSLGISGACTGVGFSPGDGDTGTFVWADAQNGDFVSTGPNQFLVRAAGGAAINSNDPAGNALRVAGTLRVDTLGTAAAMTLCRNASNQVSSCS